MKERWDGHARYLMEQQPGIQQRLIDALGKTCIITYYGLANFILNWYYTSTIYLWVIPREGYTMYSEIVIPPTYSRKRKNI